MQPKQKDFLGEILIEGIDGEIVLIGFPYEIGSKRLNSSIPYSGLENGPDCLRRFLPKLGALYNAEYDISLEKLNFKDYGNIYLQSPNQKNLEALLEKLKQKCISVYKRSAIPMIIGGGRDLVYGPIAALFEMKEKKKVLHINLMNSLDCEALYDGSKITANNFLRKILFDYCNFKETTSYKTVYFSIEENKLSKKDQEFVKQNQENIELITIKTIRKTPEIQKTKLMNCDIITQAGRVISELLEKYNDLYDYIHLSVSLESINVIISNKIR